MSIKRLVGLLTVFSVLLTLMSSFAFVSAAAAEQIAPVMLNGINEERRINYLVVYTDENEDKTTGTDDKGIEAVVNSNGTVISVGGNDSSIPKGGFVLSGSSTKKDYIEKNIKEGYFIHLDKEGMYIIVIPDDYNPFGSSTLEYTGVNSVRYENTLIIYDSGDGKKTSGTNEWGYEAVVDKDGYIISVGGNNNAIPEGGLVLSAIGEKKGLLIETARIGLSVEVDASDKTITFIYGKENAVHSPRLELEGLIASFEQAKAQYRNLNYTAVQSALDSLEEEFDKLKEGIEQEDMLAYTAALDSFGKISSSIGNLLIETPAVEGRALWIRPMEKNEAAVKKVVKEIYELGFNIVCVEGLYNNTMIFPLPEGSLFSHSPYFGGFDVLRAYIDECHRYGMELHLWMPVYRVGHDASTYPELGLGNVKPEWRNISNTGIDYVANIYGNGHYLNPALPEVSEYLLSVYEYILRNYPLDGFQLDYIRYPDRVDGVDYGYDEYTRGLFETEYGVDPQNIGTNHSLWRDWCRFRADFVTDLVLDVKALIGSLRQDVYLSCDVAPSFGESDTRMMQDTVKWISEAYIDIVYPMAYGTVDRVNTWSKETVSLAGDDVFTYIGVGNYGAQDFVEQLINIRNNGADGVAFFAYAEFTSGEYDDIPETVFSRRAVSPTFNAKNAVTAQLNFLKSRIENIIEPSGASGADELHALCENIDSLLQELADSSLKDCINDINKLVDDITAVLDEKATDEELIKAVGGDLRLITKITALSKDEEKAAYYIENPLPDMYDLSEDEQDNSQQNSESEENIGEELNTFEKIARAISIGIISFSILGLPLYFYLDGRKKRIAREYEEKSDNKDDKTE